MANLEFGNISPTSSNTLPYFLLHQIFRVRTVVKRIGNDRKPWKVQRETFGAHLESFVKTLAGCMSESSGPSDCIPKFNQITAYNWRIKFKCDEKKIETGKLENMF